MTTETFTMQPARRKRLMFSTVIRLAAVVLAVLIALREGSWLWWLIAGVMLSLALFGLLSLTRRAFVAKVDDTGVTVTTTAGKEMSANWSEIEAHTIDPNRMVGAILVKGGAGGRVRVLPVSTRDIGSEAAERLIAAMKERLPTLEYKVPDLGKKKSS